MTPEPLHDRCASMLADARARGHRPVGWAMSGDLYWLGTADELTEMLGLPVVYEVKLPPGGVWLVTEEGPLP